MEHLSLEIFDIATKENPNPTGSQYAVLPDDTTITITDTSEIFASGDVWSYEFSLNIPANAHIFGTSGDLHGSRLHEQLDRRHARLWVEGLPLFLGYIRLGDEVDVDAEGNVEITFESGQKTFDDLIDGVKATEVSVGDVEIGIALNRKRVVQTPNATEYSIRIDGLKAYAIKEGGSLWNIDGCVFKVGALPLMGITPYAQQFPKLVKSHGLVYDDNWQVVSNYDKTNIQHPYDGTPQHSFCNINVCYQMKVEDAEGNEVTGRGYTMRLARGNETTDGGDAETRYNDAPNFYLLYFIDRLFKDMGIHITENQAKDVEDLRRVFMLNYGCHYEEIEGTDLHNTGHKTPNDKKDRYGQFYLPIVGDIFYNWECAGKNIKQEDGVVGKVLLRNATVEAANPFGGTMSLNISSVEGNVIGYEGYSDFHIQTYPGEASANSYSAYRAYATGENYPNVDISEIVSAMKSMFGVRLLFDNDYKTVRIVLLRNVFRNSEVQDINCEILDGDEKTESCVRGFRMTYGKGKDDTNFYYKGFNDKLPHKKEIWTDTTDKHDYTHFELDAEYDKIKDEVAANNTICYVTPVNGNAYVVKVDEDEAVLFPSLFPVADFMDAEDGDCTGEDETIEEVQVGASPVVMNDVNGTLASLFTGDMKAPTPALPANFDYGEDPENHGLGQKIATYSRVLNNHDVVLHKEMTGLEAIYYGFGNFTVTGKMDMYLSEGFQIRLQDNYSISNGGTPFDEADPGLCFGIMRSSGKDALILYAPDKTEDEDTLNDYWDTVPGSGAIDHADTCDNYGNLWDYDGQTVISTAGQAVAKLTGLFPDSNAAFNNVNGYIASTMIMYVYDNEQRMHSVLFVWQRSVSPYNVMPWREFERYVQSLQGLSAAAIKSTDAASRRLIVEIDSSSGRSSTLTRLCAMAYGGVTDSITIDPNGVGALYGRFSLKLRAEKPNPFYDPTSDDPEKQKRYLTINYPELRQRGLCDQFYKEYSFWVRNARTLNRKVRMELAQLLLIDKTKRVRVGDVMGFIRKMQYSVSNKTGLGEVTMEIMYI